MLLMIPSQMEVAPRYKLLTLPKGRCQKKRIYLGLCPKHRTPPTRRARLGLN